MGRPLACCSKREEASRLVFRTPFLSRRSNGASLTTPDAWRRTAAPPRRGRAVAKRQNSLEKFQAELAALHQSIPEDLHLPSLLENRLEGFAALFVMVLPLLNSEGRPVFTDALLQEFFL